MPEPTASEAQEAPLLRAVQQHLCDRQADELRISDPRLSPWTFALGQEIVSQYVKSDEQGVEVGVHEASRVDVAIATPDFGTLVMSPCIADPPGDSESII
jgi:hypothetical protein